MSKLKKWGIGIGVLVIIGIIGNFLPGDSDKEKAPVTQEVSSEDVKEPSITNDELIQRLEGYETILSNNIDGLNSVVGSGDPIEMQKLFSDTKDASVATFELLSDLKSEYNGDSSEYKSINELQTAFNSLKDACNDGLKFLKNNDNKYFDKYEENIKQSNLFIDRYTEAMATIK